MKTKNGSYVNVAKKKITREERHQHEKKNRSRNLKPTIKRGLKERKNQDRRKT